MSSYGQGRKLPASSPNQDKILGEDPSAVDGLAWVDGGSGGSSFGPNTPYVHAEWGGGGLITASTNQDISFDNVNIIDVSGDTPTSITWDSDTPTDIGLDDGIYIWNLKVFAIGGTGSTATSPSKLTLASGSTVNQFDDMVGVFWNDADFVPCFETSFSGDAPTFVDTGIAIASGEAQSAGRSVASLNFAATTHDIQVDRVVLCLVRVGSIS